MPRLNDLEPAAMNTEQRAIYEAIVGGPRGGVRGPFQAWLRSPGLADPAQRLGAFCRFESALEPQLRELAIILTGRHWRAQYEFWAHARLAREAGLGDDVIEAIRTGAEPPYEDDDQRSVGRFVTEYFAENHVSDDTYADALERFGERGVVDLVGVVGYYSLVSMTLNVFEVELPEGVEPPLG